LPSAAFVLKRVVRGGSPNKRSAERRRRDTSGRQARRSLQAETLYTVGENVPIKEIFLFRIPNKGWCVPAPSR
jgi:hypothetical protein